MTIAHIVVVAVWHCGNALVSINEINLLGRVTVSGFDSRPGGGTLFRYVTSHPDRTQPFTLRGTIK